MVRPAESSPLTEQHVIPLPITIRQCVEADLPLLEWYGLFSHHREIFHATFERQKRGQNVMLVADLRGFPVGQAWIAKGYVPTAVGLWWVHGLAGVCAFTLVAHRLGWRARLRQVAR